MRKKKKEKLADEQFWATFYYMNVPKHFDAIPSHVEHVRFRLYDHVDDEDLFRMATQVKSIGMLDLDGTAITNAGIEALTTFECIREIRLKGCRAITNDAMPLLYAIKGIELLHLMGTAITPSGLTDIQKLIHLKKLLINADQEDPELEEIYAKLPARCELIVNYKDYPF